MNRKLHVLTLIAIVSGSPAFFSVKAMDWSSFFQRSKAIAEAAKATEPTLVVPVAPQTLQSNFLNKLNSYCTWKNGLICASIIGFAATIKYLNGYLNDLKLLSQIDDMLSTSSLDTENIDKKFRLSGLNLTIHGTGRPSLLTPTLENQVQNASANDKIYSSCDKNPQFIKHDVAKNTQFKSNIRKQIEFEKKELLAYLKKLSAWSNAPTKIVEKLTSSSSPASTSSSSSSLSSGPSSSSPSDAALKFTGGHGVTYFDHRKVLMLIEQNIENQRLSEDTSILSRFASTYYGFFRWDKSISSLYLGHRYNKAFDLYIALYQRYIQIIKLERAFSLI